MSTDFLKAGRKVKGSERRATTKSVFPYHSKRARQLYACQLTAVHKSGTVDSRYGIRRAADGDFLRNNGFGQRGITGEDSGLGTGVADGISDAVDGDRCVGGRRRSGLAHCRHGQGRRRRARKCGRGLKRKIGRFCEASLAGPIGADVGREQSAAPRVDVAADLRVGLYAVYSLRRKAERTATRRNKKC